MLANIYTFVVCEVTVNACGKTTFSLVKKKKISVNLFPKLISTIAAMIAALSGVSIKLVKQSLLPQFRLTCDCCSNILPIEYIIIKVALCLS